MDKKSITGLVLIMLLFVGYMYWIMPSKEQREEMRVKDSIRYVEKLRADSILLAEQEQKHLQDSLLQLAVTDSTMRDSSGALLASAMNVNLGQFSVNNSNPLLNIKVRNGKMCDDMQSL